MVFANSILEEREGTGIPSADTVPESQAKEGLVPSTSVEKATVARPEEMGYIILRDLHGDSMPDEDAPPLPLHGEMEAREWTRAALPRDSSFDTVRGYTTSHSLPTKRAIPLPGLIMVHDADRKEEERVFFGVLSLTINW